MPALHVGWTTTEPVGGSAAWTAASFEAGIPIDMTMLCTMGPRTATVDTLLAAVVIAAPLEAISEVRVVAIGPAVVMDDMFTTVLPVIAWVAIGGGNGAGGGG